MITIMKKIIFVFWFFLIAGIVMRFFSFSGGISLVFFSCIVLALLYCLFGFFIFTGRPVSFKRNLYENVNVEQVSLSIIIGVLFSISVLGIQSRLRVHAGADILLLIGISSILMFSIVVLCVSKKSFLLIIRRRWVHYIFIFFVCATLYFIPNRILVSMKFPNQPEIQRAYLEFLNNPDDEFVKEKLDVLLNENYKN